MRRCVILAFPLLLMLLLAGAPQFAQGSNVSSLEVFKVEPSPAMPLVGKQAITFVFNRRLDCASAASALRWTPEIAGEVTCQGYRLTFTPSTAWSRDAGYTFEVSPPLRAADGSPLLDAYTATFVSAGNLQVSEVYPTAGAELAPPDSSITVVFDRPVVPLQLSANARELPQPLTLSPPVAGEGEWINSAVYVFEPDAPLSGDTAYRATVHDLQAADGTALDSAYRWTFHTAPPTIIAVSPAVGSRNVILDPRIQVRFDQMLRQDLVERAFRFYAADDPGRQHVDGSFEWADDGMGFSFTPQRRLALDTTYRAMFDYALLPDLQMAHRNRTSSAIWRYQTVPAPAIKNTEPKDGETDEYPHGITLYFASPMNIDTLDGKVSIQPAPESPPQTHYSHWNKSYAVHFDTQPRQEYTVTVAPGMEDIYGHAIAEERVIRFRTAPLPPEIGLTSYAPIAFQNARQTPQRLSFNHRGVQHVDLALYKLPVVDFVARLTDPDVYHPTRDFLPDEAHLAQGWRILGDPDGNTRRTERVTLAEVGLQPGIYYAEISAPGLDLSWANNRRFINVSSAALTIKQSADALTVWAVDATTGAAIAGEAIAIYGRRAEPVGSAATDERGIAQIDLPPHANPRDGFAALLDSGEHFGFAYSQWTDGADPWQFDFPVNRNPDAYEAYVYTDRPVYRSGQPVYFRGIVREKDDVNYKPAALTSVPLVIGGPRGEEIYRTELTLNEFGSFHGEFELPATAAPGHYYLRLLSPIRRRYDSELGSVNFQVAQYRLPEYQVSLSADPPQIAAGQSAEMLLEGKYYFGGAVSGAKAGYDVATAPHAFDYRGDGSYDFGDRELYDLPWDDDDEDERLVAEGELQTDAAGQARFDLHGVLPAESGSQRWLIEAHISDESRQRIYARTPLIVHQGLFYIGARAEEYVSRAGQDSRINLIAVDWDSQPIAEQPIDIQVVERRWTSLPEQDPLTGRVTHSWEMEEVPVASGSVISDSQGKADFVYQPPKGGQYRITATARDAGGRTVRTSVYNWVAGESYIPWRQENDSSLQLVPAKENYQVGETAEALIASPFEGAAQALVTIERSGVLDIELVEMQSNSHIHAFEILPEHAPNIYVSVFLLKAADAQNPQASWRYGATQLRVDPAQYALDIQIQPDRSRAAPQDSLRYSLQVNDDSGAPIVAEVGLGLTDLAALALAERNSPYLLDTFYGEQALGVSTATSLLAAEAEEAAPPVFSQAAEGARLYSPMRDQGEGGGIAEPGIVDIRDEFVDTPYWNPTLVTDSDGNASVMLRLPDNLTTWRMDARAWTQAADGNLLVGEAAHDLISALPLLIRPVTPRFFIVGDRAQLSAVVNNNSDSDLTVGVTLDRTAGLTLDDSSAQTQHIEIEAGGRRRVSWLVDVEDVESVAPLFAARSLKGAYGDASISPVAVDDDGALPVYDYNAPETVGTAGMLREAGARVEAILLPPDLELRVGSLDVRLDKSLAGVTIQSLDYIDQETWRFWDCAASVVARLLPNIATSRAMRQLSVADYELRKRLDESIEASVAELVDRQQDDGGWSWCPGGYSDALTSAYALYGLSLARQQGYDIDYRVIYRAQRFLQGELIDLSLATARWQLNRQAFVDFALAASGAADAARSQALFESRQRLNLDAIAFLAQTLHSMDPADARLDALAQRLLNSAITRATGTFFEEEVDPWTYSTDIRTTALALDTLLKLNPNSQLVPNIVRHLVSVREGLHWRSMQETTWSVLALTNWMLHSGELSPDFSYSAALNGEGLLQNAALPGSALQADELAVHIDQLLPGETNLLQFQRSAGKGAIYYSAHLNADLPVADLQPIQRGIEISRSYVLPDGESATPVSSAQVGDTIQVRLRIVAPNTLRNVVIEDHFPAGAEAINPNLDTSQRIGAAPGGGRVDSRWRGWGWWRFDHIEFRDQKASIYASYLPRGVYEYVYSIRAAQAGEYNVIPPMAQDMHFPEVYGRGAGMRFVISD